MHQYQGNTTQWQPATSRNSGSTDLRSALTRLTRGQPELVLAGGLLGGALLALLVKSALNATPPHVSHNAYRNDNRNDNRLWPSSPDAPRPMPSARLGATEDQMESLATPSPRALDDGSAGATGSAYDLDPKSITAG